MTTTANPRAGPLAVTHMYCMYSNLGQTGNPAGGVRQ